MSTKPIDSPALLSEIGRKQQQIECSRQDDSIRETITDI